MPDSRAVFYEENLHSKRRISDLLAVLKAFKSATSVRDAFAAERSSFKSSLLQRTVLDKFPDLKPVLDFFDHAFDAKQAERDNKIVPTKGVDKAYDDSIAEIAGIQGQEHVSGRSFPTSPLTFHAAGEFEDYLTAQKSALKCTTLGYWGRWVSCLFVSSVPRSVNTCYTCSSKDRYQIEVPDAVATKVPGAYVLKSKRKGSGKAGGVCRYWTADIEKLLARLVAAEERRDAAIKDTLRRLFHRFDAHRCVGWPAAAG
jgi:DNA mismatch repair protein MSH6